MNPFAARFIEVLEQDIVLWEDAATNCEFLIPHVVGNEQKRGLAASAVSYRAQANAHRALITLMKAEHGP